MNSKINAILDALIVQDYILFGSVFILFICLLILAILLKDRRKTSRFIATFAFLLLIFGPTLGYIEMHKYLFKNYIELISQQKLNFTNAIVVKGKVTNNSKVNFSSCKITATAYKKTPKEYKNYILRLKPLQISSIILQDVPKNQTKEFKMFIEPFTYTKDYTVELQSSCRQ
jgi:hypothetical protein